MTTEQPRGWRCGRCNALTNDAEARFEEMQCLPPRGTYRTAVCPKCQEKEGGPTCPNP